jgi:hypothetical protein
MPAATPGHGALGAQTAELPKVVACVDEAVTVRVVPNADAKA